MGISAVATISFLALWAAVMYDVYRTDHRFVRQGPKWCWMIFVASLPVLGALGWLIFGRPFFMVKKDPIRFEGEPVLGPEDTPEWSEFVRFHSIMNEANRLD